MFYENLNVYSRACVFVYVSCQAMPGVRQNADLILPFTSICLQKSAGEREMHAPNTNRTLALHTEICLTRKYLMKCSSSRGKITFWFTLSTACGCATLPFQPNRFLRVFVMLTYLQSSQHGCCWCLRPGRINVMSDNSGQQSPGCYREVVLFTSSG